MNTSAPQPQSGIPPAPPHTPKFSSDFSVHVQRLIAFLLRWAGCLSPLPTPQTRELIQALQLLSTLFERHAAGAQTFPHATASRATALPPAGSPAARHLTNTPADR